MFTGTVCQTTTAAEPTTTLTTTTGGSTPCATFTTAGNANGAMCIFPFVYKGAAYYECITTANNGVLWCATTINYDLTPTWGNCQGRSGSSESFSWSKCVINI
jgi:hypothetical protein